MYIFTLYVNKHTLTYTQINTNSSGFIALQKCVWGCVCVCVFIYIWDIQKHTPIQTPTRTPTRTLTRTLTRTGRRTNLCACIHVCIYVYTYTYTYSCIYVNTCIHMQAYMYTPNPIYAYIYTQSYIYIQTHTYRGCWKQHQTYPQGNHPVLFIIVMIIRLHHCYPFNVFKRNQSIFLILISHDHNYTPLSSISTVPDSTEHTRQETPWIT